MIDYSLSEVPDLIQGGSKGVKITDDVGEQDDSIMNEDVLNNETLEIS